PQPRALSRGNPPPNRRFMPIPRRRRAGPIGRGAAPVARWNPLECPAFRVSGPAPLGHPWSSSMSGHSHWANIKHKKAKADAKRGKVWSKCARAIIVAAKNGGGDPDMNVTLRYAIEDAKANNMPNATIDNAIKKGTGEAGGQTFERVNYEGYGPAGVAIMLDILTDNRNRTAPEVRMIFSKNGGNLAGAGSVSYLFQPKGQVFLPKHAGDEEAVMSAALEAGAEDVVDQ